MSMLTDEWWVGSLACKIMKQHGGRGLSSVVGLYVCQCVHAAPETRAQCPVFVLCKWQLVLPALRATARL